MPGSNPDGRQRWHLRGSRSAGVVSAVGRSKLLAEDARQLSGERRVAECVRRRSWREVGAGGGGGLWA